MSRGQRILLVEDDEGVRRSTQLLLEWSGFDVRAHAMAASALALDSLNEIDMLVTDHHLSDGDGIQLLASLRAAGWQGRAVMITVDPSPALRGQARAAGFHAVLDKPLARHELIAALSE